MTPAHKLSPIISGSRRRIMEHLLKTDANAVTLAAQLAINISAVRNHLDVLELAGLITSRHEHAKRGRPKRIYYLTESGRALFPQQTDRLFALLIEIVNRSFDLKTTKSLIRQIVIDLWQQILAEKPRETLGDRLGTVVEALDAFGFYASLEEREGRFELIIHNDVFRQALSDVPIELAESFQLEFWEHLSSTIGPAKISAFDATTFGDHGYRVLVEGGKET